MPKSLFVALALLLSASAAWSQQAFSVDPGAAQPIDEAYRDQFRRCDRQNQFRGYSFPILNRRGTIAWYGCRSDPNNVQNLLRFAARNSAREAVYFSSKLGQDLDGS